MKINKKLLLSIFFFVLFLIFLILVLLGKSEGFDNFIYQSVSFFRCSFLDNYFIFITKFANALIIVFVVLIFLLITRNRYGVFLLVSSIDAVIMTTLIKVVVKRVRPEELRLISQGGYSFPSGHSMMSICVYGYLLYLAIKHIKNKIIKILVSSILFLVILSIGVSRIYVGVHFASDVLAGFSLGISYLCLLIYVLEKYEVQGG